jgi:ParB-like chromosome segregation protein Spo0J
MLDLRPIVVNKSMMVLGGNQRLKACIEAGLKEVPILIADELTKAEQERFIITDNVNFGDWDWDQISEDWKDINFEEWGLDLLKGWGKEEEISTKTKKENNNLMAIVVVAYENISDLDQITSLYELDREDITEEIKNKLSSEKKMYVFKK